MLKKILFSVMLTALVSACSKKDSSTDSLRVIPKTFDKSLIGYHFDNKEKSYRGVIQYGCRLFNEKVELIYNIHFAGTCKFLLKEKKVVVFRKTHVSLIDSQTKLLWRRDVAPHHNYYYEKKSKVIYYIIRRPFTYNDKTIWHDGIEALDLEGNLKFSWYVDENFDQLEKLLKLKQNSLKGRHYIDKKNRTIGVKVNSVGLVEKEIKLIDSNDGVVLRKGDILINLQKDRKLMVIDQNNGEVKWLYDQNYDGSCGAHHFRQLKNGNFAYIENCAIATENYQKHRLAQLVELDPKTKRRIWVYPKNKERAVSSDAGGSFLYLPNGNILITYEQNGSAIEITKDEEIVWEWFPSKAHCLTNCTYNEMGGLETTEVRKLPLEEFKKFL